CEKALSIAQAHLRREIPVQWIGRTGTRCPIPAVCKDFRGESCTGSKSKEACETATQDTVDAVPVADVVATPGPAAVVTQLFIRLKSPLRGIDVRSGEQIGRRKTEVQARKAVIHTGVACCPIYQQVMKLLITA